jgi:hypothetical protein
VPEIAAAEIQHNAPTLANIRLKAAEARDLKQACADLEERLERTKEIYNNVIYSELPSMMQAAGMDQLGLPAEGNNPAYDIELKRHITANIAAAWPEAQRKAAFAWLKDKGHGDLIKTAITVRLARNSQAMVKRVVAALRKLGVEPEISETVHNQTLGAWLREEITQGRAPPLDVVGGHLGNVAVLKQRKPD